MSAHARYLTGCGSRRRQRQGSRDSCGPRTGDGRRGRSRPFGSGSLRPLGDAAPGRRRRRAVVELRDVREHVDDRATRVFDEEAATAPRLVGERVDDSQARLTASACAASTAAGSPTSTPKLGGGSCISWAPMMTSARGGIGRLEVKHRIVHGHPHPQNLDVEVPGRRGVIPAGVGDDPSHSHRKNMNDAWSGPDRAGSSPNPSCPRGSGS